METIRAFIAFEPPEETVQELVEWQQANLPPNVKPEPSTNLHLTLAFLGDTPLDRIPKILDILSTLDPSTVTLSGPRRYRELEKLAFLEYDEEGGTEIWNQVNEALGSLYGFTPQFKPPWLAHTTMWRFSPENKPNLSPPLPNLSFSPIRIGIYQSVSNGDGTAIYQQIKQSNIFDPIQKKLDLSVFKGTKPRDSVVRFIERTFYKALDKEEDLPKDSIVDLVLTGSLTTYQYGDTSDCDISVFPDYDWFLDNLSLSPNEVRIKLISFVTTHLDGIILPGTEHPLQYFVVPAGRSVNDYYRKGMRSGWSFNDRGWIVSPEHKRVHEIYTEYPLLYQRAVDMADKLRTLLDAGDTEAARDMYKQVHKKRTEDENGGLGDFSEGNIVYKYLLHEGLFDRLRNEAGLKIAKITESNIPIQEVTIPYLAHGDGIPWAWTRDTNTIFLANNDGFHDDLWEKVPGAHNGIDPKDYECGRIKKNGQIYLYREAPHYALRYPNQANKMTEEQQTICESLLQQRMSKTAGFPASAWIYDANDKKIYSQRSAWHGSIIRAHPSLLDHHLIFGWFYHPRSTSRVSIYSDNYSDFNPASRQEALDAATEWLDENENKKRFSHEKTAYAVWEFSYFYTPSRGLIVGDAQEGHSDILDWNQDLRDAIFSGAPYVAGRIFKNYCVEDPTWNYAFDIYSDYMNDVQNDEYMRYKHIFNEDESLDDAAINAVKEWAKKTLGVDIPVLQKKRRHWPVVEGRSIIGHEMTSAFWNRKQPLEYERWMYDPIYERFERWPATKDTHFQKAQKWGLQPYHRWYGGYVVNGEWSMPYSPEDVNEDEFKNTVNMLREKVGPGIWDKHIEKEAGSTFFHVAPVGRRTGIQEEGLNPHKVWDKNVYLWDNMDDAEKYRQWRTWSYEGQPHDIYRVDASDVPLKKDPWIDSEEGTYWKGTGIPWRINAPISSDRLSLDFPFEKTYEHKVPTTGPVIAASNVMQIIYDFEKDHIILGTDVAAAVEPPHTIIIGEYDGKDARLNRTATQWLNANYFKRLWRASFPTRPLHNVFMDDQHLRTKEDLTYTEQYPEVVSKIAGNVVDVSGMGVHFDPKETWWTEDDWTCCFGWVDGTLYLGDTHHAKIIADLVEGHGYDWDKLLSAKQMWGWLWYHPRFHEYDQEDVDEGTCNEWEIGEPDYENYSGKNQPGTMEVQFTSDDAIQHPEVEKKVIADISAHFGVPAIRYGNMHGTRGEYGYRARDRYLPEEEDEDPFA